MMREIKFRAWDLDKGRMLFPETDFSTIPVRPMPLGLTSGGMSLNFVLLQFTGLKDKNGVEIYEGDIIEFSSAMVFGERDVVVYRAGFYRNFTMFEQSEVIGNIHQHPELLKAERTAP